MNTDKINKLIEDAEEANRGEWKTDADENASIVTDNAEIYMESEDWGTETIAETPCKEAQHIVNTQPKNIIPILRSWVAMREALALCGELAEEATHEVCTCYSNPDQSCRYCSKLSRSDRIACAAMDAADKALEELP